jgi:hypothetical protein
VARSAAAWIDDNLNDRPPVGDAYAGRDAVRHERPTPDRVMSTPRSSADGRRARNAPLSH